MIPLMAPVWEQFRETYDAIRWSLDQVPDKDLGWRAADSVPTLARIAQHISSANLLYASVIGPIEHARSWEFDDSPNRDWLLARLDESEAAVLETLSGVTEENVHAVRADDWCPLNPEPLMVKPMDALWFAMQMVRHTAYHLGQMNLYIQLLCSSSASLNN